METLEVHSNVSDRSDVKVLADFCMEPPPYMQPNERSSVRLRCGESS